MLYPIFKDDWQYTHAIASVHGTKTVFNPNYCPTEISQDLLWVEIK